MAKQGSEVGKVVAQEDSTTVSVAKSAKRAAAIVSTTLIIFIAFRNSLTYQLQRFWGNSGDFWQSCWDKVIERFGDDQGSFLVYGTTVLAFTVYWSLGSIYTLFDVTGRPKFLKKYKIQPGTNEPVETSRLLKVIGQVVFNQFVVGIPFAWLCFKAFELRGLPELHVLPTFHWVLVELVVFVLLEEIAFYYSHRMLHHRAIYKYIHKQHHEWTSPIAVTAIYCHPIEHVLSNLLPPFLGPLLMGSHVATQWLWFTMALANTLNAHCGYHLPFFSSPEAHDYHHLKFNQCFGVLGVLDYLHGTDENFRKTPQYARHNVLTTLVPFGDQTEAKKIKPK